jgi:hypothetical protein
MTVTRRVKTFVTLVAIAAGVSVAAGVGASIAGADPDTSAKPGMTKEEAFGAKDQAQTAACCYNQVVGPDFVLSPGAFVRAEVFCPGGQVVFGGGGLNSSTGGFVVLTDSYPSGPSSWAVYMKNNSTSTQYTIKAYAVCGVLS